MSTRRGFLLASTALAAAGLPTFAMAKAPPGAAEATAKAAAAGPGAKGGKPAALPPEQRDGDMLGDLTYFMTTKDTILLALAQEYDLGILEVSAVNEGVDAWIPGADKMILLPTAHLLPDAPRTPGSILINKSELRLYYFPPSGPAETHAIGIGRESHGTPDGSTTIVRKRKDPTWTLTADERKAHPELPAVMPPGPDNPMGDRAMYLGWPAYAIHSTNQEYGVGRLASRGCVRLYTAVAHHLFDALPIGTKVTTIEQPIKAGWRQGGLFLEVHPSYDQLNELEETYKFDPDQPASMDEARKLLQAKAGDVFDQINWDRVQSELTARRGIPVQVWGEPVTITGGVQASITPESPADGQVAENDSAPDGDAPVNPARTAHNPATIAPSDTSVGGVY